MRHIHILRKYGAATTIYLPIIKRAVQDFAVSADWTPVAGDVKIDKNEAGPANIATLPTPITAGNGAYWKQPLAAAEMEAAKVVITMIDAATKTIEDTMITIDTYGNASAEHAVDLDDSVRAGLTALPNSIPGIRGGLTLQGEFYSGVAASSTLSTVVLPNDAPSGDDDLNNAVVAVIKGTGKGQMRRCTDYTGATRTVTIDSAWSTLPDTTSLILVCY